MSAFMCESDFRMKIAELEAAQSEVRVILESLLPITWDEDWDADEVRRKLVWAIKFCGGKLRSQSPLDGLRYALSIIEARRVRLSTPDYRSALDDIALSLEAAIERVESGEPMQSEAICQ